MIYNRYNLPSSFEYVCESTRYRATRFAGNMFRMEPASSPAGVASYFSSDQVIQQFNNNRWTIVTSYHERCATSTEEPVRNLLDVLRPFTRVLFNSGESMLYKGPYHDGQWHFFFSDVSIKHVQTDNLEHEIMQVYDEPQLAPGFINSTAPTQVLWSRYNEVQLAALAAVKQAETERDAACMALVDARNRASELGCLI